ncbi:MAG: HD-GYP domain-containing protein [Clostridiaceae bacterium]|nr:HD-GYP domain-containing protein [Clostridiaceae bacterium]
MLALQGVTDNYEESLYRVREEQDEKLMLSSDVYVIDVPSTSDQVLTADEKNRLEEQYLEQLQYIIGEGFSSAKGVYILGVDLLSLSVTERQFFEVFRETGNVFWHYNTKNIGYYHDGDCCGQIKFIDEYYGASNYFEVYGEGKYAPNFVPYFFMTMNGNKVQYDQSSRQYTIEDASGAVTTLHAAEDGTVRVKETAKNTVKYLELEDVYKELVKLEDDQKTEKYKDAVILIQNGDTMYSIDYGARSVSSIADYYIDVLGTIENSATIPVFDLTDKILAAVAGILILGVIILVFPAWAAFLGLFAEASLLYGIHCICYTAGICYVPVVGLSFCYVLFFILLSALAKYLAKINIRNLPIDAVIRFTSNIVHIEHSVSYSEYLMKNRSEIEEDISASLLMPVMDRDSFLLEELAAENHRNKRFVETEFRDMKLLTSSVSQTRSGLFQGMRYIAFIPLPVFDVESEGVTYTVIGLKKKLKPQKASYISLMLFSMYIYFKAQHERGEHQRMYFSMLSLMISVIDAKDPVTAGHSQRVANISKDIGLWLKLSKSEQFDLEFTALLHDIGKIGVSDYVLNKQSVYTQNDFEQMKYHTIRGAEMLSEVGISEAVIDGVRHHHERIDGKGYPDGLKGDELTLFAKIIKIADVYDALTSKRQYKDAWEIQKALNIIYRGRGTEFDTEIADVFIEHMSPPGWIPPVDEKNQVENKNPNTEKASRIARDFYEKYSQYLSVEYPIPSKRAVKVDFVCKNGFMGYDWGETFNNAGFLEEKPVILDYEKNTKSLIFGQSSKGKYVSSIYYYFFKGFINMGIYLLKTESVKDIMAAMQDAYGEPQILTGQIMVFEAGKMRIVFYRTLDDKCFLFYISDYMCSNYIFEGQEREANENK